MDYYAGTDCKYCHCQMGDNIRNGIELCLLVKVDTDRFVSFFETN